MLTSSDPKEEEEQGEEDEAEEKSDDDDEPKDTKKKVPAKPKPAPAAAPAKNQPKITAFAKTNNNNNTNNNNANKITNNSNVNNDSDEEMAELSSDASVNKVDGDVTRPQVHQANEPRAIMHIVDNSGKWPQRGVFGAISRAYPEPEKSYTGTTPLKLGSIVTSKVTNTQGTLIGPLNHCSKN